MHVRAVYGGDGIYVQHLAWSALGLQFEEIATDGAVGYDRPIVLQQWQHVRSFRVRLDAPRARQMAHVELGLRPHIEHQRLRFAPVLEPRAQFACRNLLHARKPRADNLLHAIEPAPVARQRPHPPPVISKSTPAPSTIRFARFDMVKSQVGVGAVQS